MSLCLQSRMAQERCEAHRACGPVQSLGSKGCHTATTLRTNAETQVVECSPSRAILDAPHAAKVQASSNCKEIAPLLPSLACVRGLTCNAFCTHGQPVVPVK